MRSRVSSSARAARPAVDTLSAGHGLDEQTRARLEPHFGFDFSEVRIHADGQAAEAAADVDANAFTVGNDIVFGAGKYQPSSSEGQQLLAHELTHVVQHARSGPSAGDGVSHAGDASEREARSVAASVAGGQAVHVSAAPGPGLAREGAEGGEEDESFLEKAAWWLGGKIPGIGEAVDATHGLMEGMSKKDPVEKAIGFGEGIAGTLGLTAGFGGFESVFGEAGLFGEGGGIMSALTGGSLVGEGGLLGTLGTAYGAGGIEGVAGTILPSLFGGAEGAAVLPGVAGMSADAALLGGGLEGAAALGPAAAVLGAGLAGAGVGNYLSKNTEVGEDAVGAIGGIDKALGWLGIGDPEHGQSAIVAMDDYRQEQWDKGGLGYLTGTGALLGEAAVGVAGAVGGLAEGAVHGLESVGEAIWDLF